MENIVIFIIAFCVGILVSLIVYYIIGKIIDYKTIKSYKEKEFRNICKKVRELELEIKILQAKNPT